jgi:hypothetical protein
MEKVEIFRSINAVRSAPLSPHQPSASGSAPEVVTSTLDRTVSESSDLGTGRNYIVSLGVSWGKQQYGQITFATIAPVTNNCAECRQSPCKDVGRRKVEGVC